MIAAGSRRAHGEVAQSDLSALAAPDALADVPSRIDALAQRLVGHRVCSINLVHLETLEVERIYCSDPAVYPLGGRRSKRGKEWAEQVLIRGEAYVGTQPSDLTRAFDEAADHISRGLGSVINTPVMAGGRCLATLNLLHEPAWYRPEDQELTRILAYLLVPYVVAEQAAR